MEGGADSNGSLIQTMLQAMLKETSSHLMSEQQKVLQTLWNAWVEDQQTVKKIMSDQLEMIRQFQREIKTLKAQTAGELKSTREQTAEELKQMREQTAKELKEMREQLDMMAKNFTVNSAQTSPQPSYVDVARTPPTSRPSNVQTLSSSMRTTPPSFSDTWCCTIDTSRVSEEEKGEAALFADDSRLGLIIK